MENLKLFRLFLFCTALASAGVSAYLAIVGFTSNYGKGLDTYALASSIEVGKKLLGTLGDEPKSTTTPYI